MSASAASFLPQPVTETTTSASALEQFLNNVDLIMTKSQERQCDSRHTRPHSVQIFRETATAAQRSGRQAYGRPVDSGPEDERTKRNNL